MKRILTPLMLVLVLAAPLAAQQAGSTPAAPAAERKPATDYRFSVLVRADGDTLPDKRSIVVPGEVVVLDFWATWCPGCAEAYGDVNALAAIFQERGVRFYGVVIMDSRRAVERFIGEHGRPRFTMLSGITGAVRRYGSVGIPFLVVIDRHGRIAATHYGSSSVGAIVPEIQKALEEP